jgi:hypothetical protein
LRASANQQGMHKSRSRSARGSASPSSPSSPSQRTSKTQLPDHGAAAEPPSRPVATWDAGEWMPAPLNAVMEPPVHVSDTGDVYRHGMLTPRGIARTELAQRHAALRI